MDYMSFSLFSLSIYTNIHTCDDCMCVCGVCVYDIPPLLKTYALPMANV